MNRYKKYLNASLEAVNVLEGQLAPTILAEVKKHDYLDNIYDNWDIILFSEILENIFYKVKYGECHNAILTNLD